MSAISNPRDTAQFGTLPFVGKQSMPLAANVRVYSGTIVCADSAGRAVHGSADPSLVTVGVALSTGYNLTTDASGGAAGAVSIDVAKGCFCFENSSSADAISSANKGAPCYVADNRTVALTDGGGTRPFAGYVLDVGTYGGKSNQVAVTIGSLPAPSASRGASARYVMTTNVSDLAAFSVAQDGVTGVEGDVVLLAGQTTGAENGLYKLGAVSGGTCALSRAASLKSGAVVKSGFTVDVSEGTLFASTKWFVSTSGFITVGTTSHAWYPECVTQSVALVAGATTVSNVPVLSATKSQVVLTRRIANTATSTVMYAATSGGANGVTAGSVGTAAVIVQACVAAGTLNNADVSTLNISIVNR